MTVISLRRRLIYAFAGSNTCSSLKPGLFGRRGKHSGVYLLFIDWRSPLPFGRIEFVQLERTFSPRHDSDLRLGRGCVFLGEKSDLRTVQNLGESSTIYLLDVACSACEITYSKSTKLFTACSTSCVEARRVWSSLKSGHYSLCSVELFRTS